MTSSEPLARYYFVPTVREGLAAYLTNDAAATRAEVLARVTPRIDGLDETAIEKRVGLYGPGDVLGLNSRVVSRTDPPKNVWDFEANMLVQCEFTEPDLPWRLTPRAAEPSGKLIPWLTLIVLAANEFNGIQQRPAPDNKKSTMPIQWIEQVSISALPDLSHAWMWAHAQVTASNALSNSDVRDRLSAEEDSHVISRLICPRRLAPGTKYTAFIVPTFKISHVAAGLVPALGIGEHALTPAWDVIAQAGEKINLQYHYRFEFGTAAVRGDFEYLVRLLQPKPLPNLGKRLMDCSEMPYALPACPGENGQPHLLNLEGALMSPDLCPGQWANDTPEIISFRSELAGIINMPALLVDSDVADASTRPPVVPPIYGRWHTTRRTVDPAATTSWQDDLNMDPRQRAAAGLGTLVVQKEQEALRASMWEQLGAMDQANDIIRHAQLGVGASKNLYTRLGRLRESHFLWTAAPIFGRVRAPASLSTSPASIAKVLNDSPIPRAALDPAFRRIIRPRGHVRKRQRDLAPAAKGQDLLSRLNNGEAAAAGPAPPPAGMPSMCAVTNKAVAALISASAPARAARNKYRLVGRVRYVPSNAPVPGVKVEAWDKDPFFSDMLGTAVTDEHGSFIVEFDAGYYQEWFLDKRPDLYFKVFYKGSLITTTRPVTRDVRAGDTPVTIDLADQIGTTPGTSPPQTMDFCEAAIAPETIVRATDDNAGAHQLQRDAALAIGDAIVQWLRPLHPLTPKPSPVNLTAVYEAVKAAINPARTIPARVSKRLKLGPGVRHRGDDLGLLESEVEFPQPMYESLAALSKDFVLPGLDTVPVNVVSLLKSNRRFQEDFLAGLNSAWGSEAVWSGARMLPSTTVFRQFWNVQGYADPDADPDETKDITRMTTWRRASILGSHDPRPGPVAEQAVLILRSDLLRRFPSTLIYAVESQDNNAPALSEYDYDGPEPRAWPIFSGSLPPDVTFLGFNKTIDELADGGPHDNGYYIVIEERLSQPRFGFDVQDGPDSVEPALPPSTTNWWYDLTWAHLQPNEPNSYINGKQPTNVTSRAPVWGQSSATMANITLQRPVRVCIHARRMLSKLQSFGCED